MIRKEDAKGSIKKKKGRKKKSGGKSSSPSMILNGGTEKSCREENTVRKHWLSRGAQQKKGKNLENHNDRHCTRTCCKE